MVAILGGIYRSLKRQSRRGAIQELPKVDTEINILEEHMPAF
jgi:hypothetical protein